MRCSGNRDSNYNLQKPLATPHPSSVMTASGHKSASQTRLPPSPAGEGKITPHLYRRNEHLVCRGRRPRRPVTNANRQPHLYRRNEHLVCRDRRPRNPQNKASLVSGNPTPRLSVMSDYRKPHIYHRNEQILVGEGLAPPVLTISANLTLAR